jgi:NADH-quinone oxidoreductase subunit G
MRVLGNMIDAEGFDYLSSQDVLAELEAKGSCQPDNNLQSATSGEPLLVKAGIERIADLPIYAADAIVRRAGSLQHTVDSWNSAIRLNSKTAGSVGLEDGLQASIACDDSEKVSARVIIDERVSDDSVWFPAAVAGAEKLSRLFGEVTLDKG